VKDNEIKDLRKRLNEANDAKASLEVKLLDVMNDAVASQSTRNLMKSELEHKLNEENEKAASLQQLIDDREKDIKRLTTEFDILRVEMKKESYLRREEISDLNGEVVEKSTLLSSKEREFLKFKTEMEELKLQHASEIDRLRRQIDDFGANETEMKKIKQFNLQLSSNLALLKTEIQRISMNDALAATQDSSNRILRARNEQLMDQVERLNKKIRRMKRNVTLIEL
jgi:chromosome segregation ATPase